MEIALFEIVTAFSILIVSVYYYLTWTFDFWKNKNVKGPKPKLIFGNMKDVMLRKCSIGELLKKFYDDFPEEKFIGIFTRREPNLIIKDANLIKDILIKDFSVFADRGSMAVVEKVEPLNQHLFNLESERWRPLRTKLSPTFTSGKLKEMFYLILNCAEKFNEFLGETIEKNNVVDCREMAAKFATDVIGECAFGIKMNALSNEESEFRKMGQSILKGSPWVSFKISLREAAPWLFKLLTPIFSNKKMNDFFINIMRENVKFRKENNVRRNDFVDLLIDIQANPKKVNDLVLDDVLMTAQAFVFFIAGFETSSSTMSNALYELALNQKMQDTLRDEIIAEIESNDGKLVYESIKNMPYLHKVFCETLRKYPSVLTLTRRSLDRYTFNDVNLTIPKGTKVFIPAYAIHRDPKIYPDPEVFDPERFSEENIQSRHPSFYLPFGDGPRNCIGARFGNYQTKVGIITVLKDYRVEVCDKTKVPLVGQPSLLLYAVEGGIPLKFTKIHK